MGPPGSEPTRWAILIGVGVTISRKNKDSRALVSDRSLQRAVNDIQSMEKYLESRPFAINTIRLTATKSTDSPLKSTESVDRLPTLDNVVSALKKVLKASKPNDHVYIYYSGHGSCRAIDGAVALELVNPLTLETEYLYGTVLRSAINKMIEKGLTVTLVLDCCFSGSVLRDDRPDVGDIRYLDHDNEYDNSFDNPFDGTDPEELRDGVITLSRLLDPQGYTIITACGPHEVASELKYEGGATSGALSYFLINSLVLLSRRGKTVSNEMLHQHLRAQFHARLPDQTPMLYGHRGFAFFGDFSDDIRQAVASTVSIHRSMENGCLILHAGQAHGVHKNDEYALTPFNRTTNPKHRDSIRSRVYEVDCFSSKIETVDPMNIAVISRGSTWEATLLTSFSRRKIQICLDFDKSVCATLIQAASATTYLELCHKSSADRIRKPLSYVVKKIANDYEIRDLTAKHNYVVARVPYEPKGDSGALFDALDHISSPSPYNTQNGQILTGVFTSNMDKL
ncbi:caspase [Fusarium pseudocircinatum]|uniref:Caspase n=1 Tax=Fusarium pseudocircinatum TaxID=56676 RepID=A0A8H5UM53_9HYPO|nr:caspase [Fusarium pseudocircinatum]